MAIFIKGVGNISPQLTYDGRFLDEIQQENNVYLLSQEPDYKAFLNPTMTRRMGRILKMGVASANICLHDAKVEIPDAIITGTGLGCLVDTEKFLTSIIENEEQLLTPTSFIQSTHNTISAQIALMIKCLNYNYTYVHRGFSFESSLQDSMMMLNEGEAKNILVGGVDEITEAYYRITQRLGFWKPDLKEQLTLSESNTKGALCGEGAVYFVLSKEEDVNNYAEIKGLDTLYKPKTGAEVESFLSDFINRNNHNTEDIDLVIYGISGDKNSDNIYHSLRSGLFKFSNSVYFKHLSGEYHTASAFGTWLAAKILKTQYIPHTVKLGNISDKEIRNILIYNHYRDVNHSAFILSKV